MLAATVPDNWPPESAADALPLFLSWMEASPGDSGWYAWYALLRAESAAVPVLVGGGGFLGPPAEGAVQLGYAVLAQFQRQGYASEMVGGLVGWAFQNPGVHRIVAETEWANPGSVRVLEKSGFAAAGPASEPGGVRYELLRP